MDLPILSSDSSDYIVLEKLSTNENDSTSLFIVRRKGQETLEDLELLLLQKIKFTELKLAVSVTSIIIPQGITYEDIFLNIEGSEFYLCIISEFLPITLYDVISRNNTTPVSQVREWCQQLFQAIHFLHQNNLTHGNIDLQNIYLNSSKRLILGSFAFYMICTGDMPLEEFKKSDSVSLGWTLLQLVKQQILPPNCRDESLLNLIPSELSSVKDLISSLLKGSSLDSVDCNPLLSNRPSIYFSSSKSNEITRKQLTYADVDVACQVLASAAMEDPRYIALIPDREKRFQILSTKVMRNMIAKFLRHTAGLWGVFKGDRLVAVCTWANPDNQKHMPTLHMLKTMLFSSDIKFKTGVSLVSLLAKGIKKAKKLLGNSAVYVIFYLGVLPEFQRNGYGTFLVENIFEWATHDKLPVMAFSFDPNAGTWMQKIGFRTIFQKSASTGSSQLDLCVMVRDHDTPLHKRASTTGLYQSSLIANSNDSLTHSQLVRKQTQQKIEVSEVRLMSDITIQSKIGNGNFGEVYKGLWQETTVVALKKLKDNSHLDEFLAEAKVLQHLEMPFIVRFFGIFVDPEGDQYMVTEFMSCGSLKQFLTNRENQFEVPDLLAMARDTAAGMKFMASKGFIHRDLATRNLLVKQEDQRFAVKIADFGMARLTETNYYASDSQVPIRWSPPEVLTRKKFSSKSDTWSYGVVLWEIFEYGKEPYYNLGNHKDVIEAVLAGHCLSKPVNCPDSVYSLMQRCWDRDPEKRPSFEEIYNEMVALLKETPSKKLEEEMPITENCTTYGRPNYA